MEKGLKDENTLKGEIGKDRTDEVGLERISNLEVVQRSIKPHLR